MSRKKERKGMVFEIGVQKNFKAVFFPEIFFFMFKIRYKVVDFF